MPLGQVIAAWCAIFSLCAAAAHGQTVYADQGVRPLQRVVWQEQDGLPQNTVRNIMRTRDGYLWLATSKAPCASMASASRSSTGATRPAIGVSLILDMLEDGAGNLWLATDGTGIVRRSPDGVFTRFSTEAGLSVPHVECLLEDHGGDVVGRDGRWWPEPVRQGPSRRAARNTGRPDLGVGGGCAAARCRCGSDRPASRSFVTATPGL